MTKKVLVLNPPSPDKGYINRDLMGGMGVYVKFGGDFLSKFLSIMKSKFIRIPVVQLVYGATLLEKEGFEVSVIDAGNEGLNLKEVIQRSIELKPDFVLMAVSSSGIIFERDIVAKSLKKELPELKIIVVGDMITEVPSLMLPYFDVSIMGEVENSIINICSGKNLDIIQGLLLNKHGVVINTGESKKIQQEELENLPLPSWNLFPYKTYRYYPLIRKTPVASIQASRGCPYGCGYCPYTKNQGRPWRARSAENIFEEVMHDVKIGFKGFFFRDPLFTMNLKRVEDLCNLIINNSLNIEFTFETRPELLTRDLINKLSEAGCSSINFGVEDINPEILKMISRKPVEPEKIREVIHYCELKGIRTSCFFILGLPGSTKETIEESIVFSKTLFASQVEYKVATPYPGTDLYHMAKEKGWLINESFDTLTGYTSSMQISTELSPEYLEERANKAFNDYYFSPKYLMRELKRGRIFKHIYFGLKCLFM